MARYLKNVVKQLLRHYNRHLVWWQPGTVGGFDFHADLKLVINTGQPLCLDVGANCGQTISLLKTVFARPQIHAFEPSSETFRSLQANPVARGVQLYNYALGREVTHRQFFNYAKSPLSSFLPLDQDPENRFRDITLRGVEAVEIKTVDWFLKQHDISKVDLLKIDTQGFDLEVLAGATEALRRGSIRNVLIEVNFVRMYEGQGSASDILNFLKQHRLELVDYYEKARQKNALAWCTALFSRAS